MADRMADQRAALLAVLTADYWVAQKVYLLVVRMAAHLVAWKAVHSVALLVDCWAVPKAVRKAVRRVAPMVDQMVDQMADLMADQMADLMADLTVDQMVVLWAAL